MCSLFRVLGQTEELVKALQDLENAASGDATVRQKIASLPQEVQDVSLLEKITGQAQEPYLNKSLGVFTLIVCDVNPVCTHTHMHVQAHVRNPA